MTPDAPAYIIIGDVHGAIDELRQLLRDVEPEVNEGAHIVFVGDYIDRGPNGPGIVKLVRNLVETGYATAIMGNHEEIAIRAMKRGEPVDFDPADAEWLRNLPVMIDLPGALVVHGGLAPRDIDTHNAVERLLNRPFSELRGRDKRIANKVMRTRLVEPDTGTMVALGQESPAARSWTELYDGRYGIIYFGHEMEATPTQYAVPLDGGAAFGGVLRAAIHDSATGTTRQLVEVPTLDKYADRLHDNPIPLRTIPNHI